jgi:hypothetical protein
MYLIIDQNGKATQVDSFGFLQGQLAQDGEIKIFYAEDSSHGSQFMELLPDGEWGLVDEIFYRSQY